jgi:hypothetical protein
MAISMIGMAVLIIFVHHSLPYHLGVWIASGGCVIVVCATLRLAQAVRAGQAFRGRPPGYGKPGP